MIYFRSPRSNCNDIHKMYEILKIQDKKKKIKSMLFCIQILSQQASSIYFDGLLNLNISVNGISKRYSHDIQPLPKKHPYAVRPSSTKKINTEMKF